MFIGFIAILAAQSMSTSCGYAEHIQKIDFTESLIVKRVALDANELIGELPTKEGHAECVRLAFNIDAKGHARDISIDDSSNDITMNMVARRALEAYRFRRRLVMSARCSCFVQFWAKHHNIQTGLRNRSEWIGCEYDEPQR